MSFPTPCPGCGQPGEVRLDEERSDDLEMTKLVTNAAQACTSPPYKMRRLPLMLLYFSPIIPTRFAADEHVHGEHSPL